MSASGRAALWAQRFVPMGHGLRGVDRQSARPRAFVVGIMAFGDQASAMRIGVDRPVVAGIVGSSSLKTKKENPMRMKDKWRWSPVRPAAWARRRRSSSPAKAPGMCSSPICPTRRARRVVAEIGKDQAQGDVRASRRHQRGPVEGDRRTR